MINWSLFVKNKRKSASERLKIVRGSRVPEQFGPSEPGSDLLNQNMFLGSWGVVQGWTSGSSDFPISNSDLLNPDVQKRVKMLKQVANMLSSDLSNPVRIFGTLAYKY